jgi:hypothetical protein
MLYNKKPIMETKESSGCLKSVIRKTEVDGIISAMKANGQRKILFYALIPRFSTAFSYIMEGSKNITSSYIFPSEGDAPRTPKLEAVSDGLA